MSEEQARAEFRRVLNPLVIAMGAKFDAAQWVLYWQVLQDVPLPLLEAAVETCAKGSREFMPKPGQLRTMAEEARQALSAALVYQPCGECVSGWRDTDSRAVERCDCWTSHQRRLAESGVLSVPIPLPGDDLRQLPVGDRE